MPKPFASARISEELNTAIEKRSKKTGESRSDIIINALRAYLEADADVPLSPDKRFEALEARVAYLEAQLKKPEQMALFDNDPDTQAEPNNSELSTLELEDLGFNRGTLDSRRRRDNFPYSKDGITVVRRLRKEKINNKLTTIWEVSRDS